MGHGKGFYDRFLANYKEKHDTLPVLVALCLSCQLIDAVPVDVHDVPMDYIITPTEVITINNKHF